MDEIKKLQEELNELDATAKEKREQLNTLWGKALKQSNKHKVGKYYKKVCTPTVVPTDGSAKYLDKLTEIIYVEPFDNERVRIHTIRMYEKEKCANRYYVSSDPIGSWYLDQLTDEITKEEAIRLAKDFPAFTLFT